MKHIKLFEDFLNEGKTNLTVVGYSELGGLANKKPDVQKILNKNKIKGIVGYNSDKDVVITGIRSKDIEKIKGELGKFGLFSFLEEANGISLNPETK
jgi:hypothetical protein